MPRTRVHATTTAVNGHISPYDLRGGLPEGEVTTSKGKLRVKGLTGYQRDYLFTRAANEKWELDREGYPEFRALVISFSLLNPDGSRLATRENLDEVLAFVRDELPAADQENIWTVAAPLSGFGSGNEAKEAMEAVKTDPSGTPGSD